MKYALILVLLLLTSCMLDPTFVIPPQDEGPVCEDASCLNLVPEVEAEHVGVVIGFVDGFTEGAVNEPFDLHLYLSNLGDEQSTVDVELTGVKPGDIQNLETSHSRALSPGESAIIPLEGLVYSGQAPIMFQLQGEACFPYTTRVDIACAQSFDPEEGGMVFTNNNFKCRVINSEAPIKVKLVRLSESDEGLTKLMVQVDNLGGGQLSGAGTGCGLDGKANVALGSHPLLSHCEGIVDGKITASRTAWFNCYFDKPFDAVAGSISYNLELSYDYSLNNKISMRFIP